MQRPKVGVCLIFQGISKRLLCLHQSEWSVWKELVKAKLCRALLVIVRILALTLNEMGHHWRVLSRAGTWSDLHELTTVLPWLLGREETEGVTFFPQPPSQFLSYPTLESSFYHPSPGTWMASDSSFSPIPYIQSVTTNQGDQSGSYCSSLDEGGCWLGPGWEW